jgi:hypothetical protein
MDTSVSLKDNMVQDSANPLLETFHLDIRVLDPCYISAQFMHACLNAEL